MNTESIIPHEATEIPKAVSAAAAALGRRGKGRPKNYSVEYRRHLADRMRQEQKKRWPSGYIKKKDREAVDASGG